MEKAGLKKIFTQNFIDELLPLNLSDQFFEALYGDASEGAYDINLQFKSADTRQVELVFHLVQRPDKCLACSLTYGLPNVFSRHPLINIKNMVNKIEEKGVKIKAWHLGITQEINSSLHIIPLYFDLE
ncbi:MAG: pancreas/duodenum homeobox protein 1 [Desulfobacula sp.]|nr:pancreas/duodenum homeobox protein 1 [Desulfobacula sp.]